jgi:hypothetical protein
MLYDSPPVRNILFEAPLPTVNGCVESRLKRSGFGGLVHFQGSRLDERRIPVEEVTKTVLFGCQVAYLLVLIFRFR